MSLAVEKITVSEQTKAFEENFEKYVAQVSDMLKQKPIRIDSRVLVEDPDPANECDVTVSWLGGHCRLELRLWIRDNISDSVSIINGSTIDLYVHEDGLSHYDNAQFIMRHQTELLTIDLNRAVKLYKTFEHFWTREHLSYDTKRLNS